MKNKRFACKWWTENLHQNGHREGTHDLGFMVEPWARRAWELNGDLRALGTLKQAAQTLVARFSPKHGLLRSWDVCKTKKYNFQDPNTEFLVVIVSHDPRSSAVALPKRSGKYSLCLGQHDESVPPVLRGPAYQ